MLFLCQCYTIVITVDLLKVLLSGFVSHIPNYDSFLHFKYSLIVLQINF